MKEVPMLFSTPMVQAILEGRKTMTRRVVKPQPGIDVFQVLAPGRDVFTTKWEKADYWTFTDGSLQAPIVENRKCPYGKVGDVIWVRESYKIDGSMNHGESVLGVTYKAGGRWIQNDSKEVFEIFHKSKGGWRPSIHIPKAAARIWLQVEDIKVERLQDISEEDAVAEGLKVQQTKLGESYFDYTTGYHNGLFKPRASFRTLWQSLHSPESWEANPWVWAVKFKVLSITGKPGVLTNQQVSNV